MDKLDAFGDNFRNVPICVPNETEADAQAFKEKIAQANHHYSSSYINMEHDGNPTLLNRDNINPMSILLSMNNSNSNSAFGWSGDSMSHEMVSELGGGGSRKKMKKSKREKKESKR